MHAKTNAKESRETRQANALLYMFRARREHAKDSINDAQLSTRRNAEMNNATALKKAAHWRVKNTKTRMDKRLRVTKWGGAFRPRREYAGLRLDRLRRVCDIAMTRSGSARKQDREE
uniref:Uncharacterized protein n=1 Tax=Mycena chlorophos TaxID=658473 RepID=A0ABQ0LH41_MYCCL|nr:predicted protein [Mycena chlorophos]